MSVIIIGSGVAGVSFAEKYRSLNPNADIVLITKEYDGYYSRPLLSRGFSKNDIEQSIVLKPFAKLRDNGIQILENSIVSAISPEQKTITVNGEPLAYDTLIIATGSRAFIPPPFRPFKELFYCFNSLQDLKTLRRLREKIGKPHWAIIGGGLIGCELASDMATAGDNVTLFHALDRLMERQLAQQDSETLLNVLEQSGVTVLFNQAITHFSQQAQQLCLHSDTERCFDAVIVACGFAPRTELAKDAGLTVGRGIKVNEFLQTNVPDIYALGDVAELPNGQLYPFILPIRNQAIWLAEHLSTPKTQGWTAPEFQTKAKVHGFEAKH